MNVLSLSRFQFALTAGIHYLYPPLSIGLGVMLVIIEGLWLQTGQSVYHHRAHRRSGGPCLYRQHLLDFSRKS